MKRWWGMLAAALAIGASIAPASAATSPDGFVQQQIGDGIAILGNKALSTADRSARIEALLSTFLDLKRMAVYTLGPAAQSSPASDVASFVAAYRQFAVRTYESELGAFNGQALEVRGAKQRGPGDYVVTGFVTDSGDSSAAPVQVDFRVLEEDGRFVVVDTALQGIWFTQMQREQFVAFLGRNGGSIAKLIDRLGILLKRTP
jgi:ABC-type transporter MlaC component